MKTLAVIPARLGASRLPRKPLRLLAGLPLVVRVWQRVESMRIADRCVIATDSDEVVDAVRPHGAEALLTSPEHASGTDRVAEVAARPEFRAFDAIVNVQGDEPFVTEAALRGAVNQVTSGDFPLGTSAARAPATILDERNVVKVVAADDGRAMYFSRAAIPFLRDAAEAQLRDTRVWQHIGVYAYARDALARWVSLPPHPLEQIERLEQLRPLAAGIAMGVALIDERPAVGVDTLDDLARANADWKDLNGRS
ncbi:MAG TPA: 3-deoxy-manno-octulosonate cytidylyltransferase [Gemmatimonadaceae bacterium]|nr:3-deoxy-manno-octulosonate cytidylyltransferase [Gemmatimonadaceae bacterium]